MRTAENLVFNCLTCLTFELFDLRPSTSTFRPFDLFDLFDLSTCSTFRPIDLFDLSTFRPSTRFDLSTFRPSALDPSTRRPAQAFDLFALLSPLFSRFCYPFIALSSCPSELQTVNKESREILSQCLTAEVSRCNIHSMANKQSTRSI